MKVVIAGGTGQVGQILRAHFNPDHEVVVLSRSEPASDARSERFAQWDGKTLGPWAQEIDDADVVINLAGRTVDCRYTKANMDQMMRSRVDSTRVIGEAISNAQRPPRVWLQMSTATIYAHRFDQPNDEFSGVIGGNEPGVPDYWSFSIDIATAWEKALAEANTPQTRKVAMRSAIVMSPHRGGPFDILRRMTRLGLGGAIGGGRQYVSWIHEHDFVRIVDLLIDDTTLEGPINLAAPTPLTQRAFMADLRRAAGVKIGLPATRWMAELGAFILRTDTELILKSRYVVSKRLEQKGYIFEYSDWASAARELCRHQ